MARTNRLPRTEQVEREFTFVSRMPAEALPMVGLRPSLHVVRDDHFTNVGHDIPVGQFGVESIGGMVEIAAWL